MEKEIIILSDLWGRKKGNWHIHYEKILSDNYRVKFYDSCELGGIDLGIYDERNIHGQFVEFGIEKAVSKLLSTKRTPKIFIGCSVGGVILWKAGLRGLPIKKLITISATRLRKEKDKPSCPVKMYFGTDDEYKPDASWLKSMGDKSYEILNGNHHLYKDPPTISRILNDLNQEKWIDLR